MRATKIVKKFILPVIGLGILYVFYGAYVAKLREGLRISWHSVLDRVFFVLAVLLLAYWISSIAAGVLSFYGRRLAKRTHTTLDDDFIPLARKIAGVIVWVIALAVIFNYMGVNINALIATLGVGSLAIALAAQDTISNVIAGFLIIMDRPFRIGDDIKLPTGERATVLGIGNRRSKFRAEDGSILIVPNVDLSKSKIVNYTYGETETATEKGGKR